MHWALPYIGRPWHPTAEGPDAFYCWSFVRFIQAQHFGRDLPTIPNPEDLLAMVRAFHAHPERKRWDRVEFPAEGDCVLMRQARYPIHVGVWLGVDGGGVLHCARESGVVFQRLQALTFNGWQIEGFYRFNGGPAEGEA